MMLLAVDPAQRCGYALGTKTGAPQAGVFDLYGFDDKNAPRSFAGIYSSVRALCAANRIEGFVIEAPLRLGGKSAHTERNLTMLSGAAQAAAINGGVKWVRVVAPTTWRKAVLGHGFPKNPKDAALEYCRMMKWNITDHNAGEAALMLVWAHGQAKLL